MLLVRMQRRKYMCAADAGRARPPNHPQWRDALFATPWYCSGLAGASGCGCQAWRPVPHGGGALRAGLAAPAGAASGQSSMMASHRSHVTREAIPSPFFGEEPDIARYALDLGLPIHLEVLLYPRIRSASPARGRSSPAPARPAAAMAGWPERAIPPISARAQATPL